VTNKYIFWICERSVNSLIALYDQRKVSLDPKARNKKQGEVTKYVDRN